MEVTQQPLAFKEATSVGLRLLLVLGLRPPLVAACRCDLVTGGHEMWRERERTQRKGKDWTGKSTRKAAGEALVKTLGDLIEAR